MTLFLLALLLTGSRPTILSSKQVERSIDAMITEAPYADAFWGIAVYAPLRGKYLYEHNSRRNFRTASNLKILTTLLGFHFLGPDYRFQTAVYTNGSVRDGVLIGDLIVVGGGDPSFGDHEVPVQDVMAPLLLALKSKGITRIQGNLLADLSFFDEETIPESWEYGDLGLYYANPVSPLCYGNARTSLNVEATDENVALVRFAPELIHRFSVETFLTHSTQEAQNIVYQREWGTDNVILSGNLPTCTSWSVRLATWHPELRFMDSLRFALEKERIPVTGVQRTMAAGEGQARTLLTLFESDPLRLIAVKLMQESDNNYANMLLKTIAREIGGVGHFAKGAEIAAAWLEEICPDGSSGFSLADGSGMSVRNYLTPRQLIALLDEGIAAFSGPQWLATFPAMDKTNPSIQQAAVGSGSRNNTWAKTGYIFRARNLSGYIETLWGEPLYFSIMANNYGTPTHSINQVIDRICAQLIHLKPDREVRRRSQDRRHLSRMLEKPP